MNINSNVSFIPCFIPAAVVKLKPGLMVAAISGNGMFWFCLNPVCGWIQLC